MGMGSGATSRRDGNFPWAAALFVLLLSLNAALVSPFIGWYDSGEMIGATVCLGISHPSGQVLFHLLGKCFLLLPWGTPAYRLGLMSAFCSALASVLFWTLSLRLAGSPPSPRLKGWCALLALAWSFSLPWWRYSLMPLVYALHLLLGLLVLWALSLEKPAKWPLAFLILGAATVFRPTQFFALPFVGLAFLHYLQRESAKPFGAADKRRGPKITFAEKLLKAIASPLVPLSLSAFILGRSTAFYLPLRSSRQPELAYASLTHFRDAFRHLFALRFSRYVGEVTVSSAASVLSQMFSHFWNDLSVLGLVILGGGLLLAVRQRRNIPVFLWVGLAWGALEILFVFTIPFPTFESHQMLLGWVFSGLLGGLVLAWLDQRTGKDKARSLAVAVLLVLWVLVQGLAWGHLRERRGERGAQDYARNILDLMPPGALYLPTEENEFFPVIGYQQSFQYRKSVEVVEPGTKPEAVAPKIRECLEGGRSLFVSRKWPLPPGWSFRAVGPLLRVAKNFEPQTPRESSPRGSLLALWGKIGLVQASLSPGMVRAGGMVEISYRWIRRGESPCDATESVVGLFSDEKGNVWMKNGVFWFHDIHEGPLGLLARMRPGLEYEEKRILFVPSDFPPGRYQLAVGLQKAAPDRFAGKEAFGREFYERGGYQDLGKFMGRGEDGAVVQFSAAAAGPLGLGLWPTAQVSGKNREIRFVPAAELEILPAEKE